MSVREETPDLGRLPRVPDTNLLDSPDRSRWRRFAGPTAGAVGLGVLVTAGAIAAGELKVGYEARTLQTALETAGALVALLAAYLVYRCHRLRPALDDLLLSVALGVFAVAGLTLAVPSASRAAVPADRFVAWAPLALWLVAASLLAAAAFTPARRVRRPAAVFALLVTAAVVATAAIDVGVWRLGESLPRPVVDGATQETFAGLSVVGPPSLLVCEFVLALLLALAAFGFVRRADTDREELAAWLAAACVLAAFAPLDYILLTSPYRSWIYGNDLLRLSAPALVVVGAMLDLERRRREAARAALDAERRRFAWALHDDLTQDVATIALRARTAIASDEPEPWLEEIVDTAERALDLSRSAITILSQTDRPFAELLETAAEDASARTGLRTSVTVESDADPDVWATEALVRVVREAIANAARHGSATDVAIEVTGADGLRLVVRDNGRGFDVERALAERTGFGLASIRERIEELGGTFEVTSAPGRGTVVGAVVP